MSENSPVSSRDVYYPEPGTQRAPARGRAMSPWRRWTEAALLVAIFAAVGWFYHWTVSPEVRVPFRDAEGRGYYALLAKGFLKGQLSMALPADPFLATLKNPWNPAERGPHGLHDASYYQGRYYLYFGVTPVVILFLPFRLLTGADLDQAFAVGVFALIGLAASIWLLAAVRRRYFPQAPTLALLGGALALGLADMMPALLRRPGVWEVPITCAYACFMMALAALYQSMHSSGARRVSWAAASSLLIGLAVGARPVYLVACASWLWPLAAWAREAGGWRACWRSPSWRRSLLAVVIPAACVGAGLAAYNYARFGSVAEFGQRYQMSGDDATKLTLFSWRYAWYSFRLYVLAPAGLGPFFPFFQMAHLPQAPAGQLGVEDPYGILPNIPFVLLGIALFGAAVRCSLPEGRRFGVFCGVLAAATLLTMATVMCFGGVTNRYMVDFVPGLILLAATGWLSLTSLPWWRGWKRAVCGGLVVLLLAWSVIFNAAASIVHNGLLRAEHPAVYERLARRFDPLVMLAGRIIGCPYGPLEITLVFPDDGKGGNEPLVVTGREFLSDYLFVNYAGKDSAYFGFIHTNHNAMVGPLMRFEPGKPHVLRVDMGSLYPPAGHPWYAGKDGELMRRMQRTLRVTLDGRIALDRWTHFYDPADGRPAVGNSGGRAAFRAPFRGKILSVRTLSGEPPPKHAMEYGPVRLVLTLPLFSSERSDPLLCSGEPGHGDLVYLHYVDASHISFGHDHWGWASHVSPVVEIDPGAQQVVEIDCPVLYPAAGEKTSWRGRINPDRCVIRLNGRVVWDVATPFFACRADSVEIGENATGSTSAWPSFSGGIVEAGRLPSSIVEGRP